MRIYYLTPRGHNIVHKLDTAGLGGMASHAVYVEGGDWYAARAKAFQHAAHAGERQCLIVVGHCAPFQVHRTQDNGKRMVPKVVPVAPHPYSDHALVLYVSRMLRQHVGAVLVPPLGAVAQIPTGWARQTPVIPMVAAYTVAAVMSVDHTTSALGYNLSKAGFRVVTLGDYAFEQKGPTVLDEYGTKTKWEKAYDEATRAFL
jgi:hypothetical protein